MAHFLLQQMRAQRVLSDLTHITQLVSVWAKIRIHTPVWLQSRYPSLGDTSGEGAGTGT